LAAWAAGAIIGGAIGAVVSTVTHVGGSLLRGEGFPSVRSTIAAAAGGAVGGAVTGAIVGAAAGAIAGDPSGLVVAVCVGAVAGAAGSAAQSTVTQVIATGEVDPDKVIADARTGFIVGGITGGLTSPAALSAISRTLRPPPSLALVEGPALPGAVAIDVAVASDVRAALTAGNIVCNKRSEGHSDSRKRDNAVQRRLKENKQRKMVRNQERRQAIEDRAAREWEAIPDEAKKLLDRDKWITERIKQLREE
jgi:hypothetical protein